MTFSVLTSLLDFSSPYPIESVFTHLDQVDLESLSHVSKRLEAVAGRFSLRQRGWSNEQRVQQVEVANKRELKGFNPNAMMLIDGIFCDERYAVVLFNQVQLGEAGVMMYTMPGASTLCTGNVFDYRENKWVGEVHMDKGDVGMTSSPIKVASSEDIFVVAFDFKFQVYDKRDKFNMLNHYRSKNMGLLKAIDCPRSMPKTVISVWYKSSCSMTTILVQRVRDNRRWRVLDTFQMSTSPNVTFAFGTLGRMALAFTAIADQIFLNVYDAKNKCVSWNFDQVGFPKVEAEQNLCFCDDTVIYAYQKPDDQNHLATLINAKDGSRIREIQASGGFVLAGNWLLYDSKSLKVGLFGGVKTTLHVNSEKQTPDPFVAFGRYLLTFDGEEEFKTRMSDLAQEENYTLAERRGEEFDQAEKLACPFPDGSGFIVIENSDSFTIVAEVKTFQ